MKKIKFLSTTLFISSSLCAIPFISNSCFQISKNNESSIENLTKKEIIRLNNLDIKPKSDYYSIEEFQSINNSNLFDFIINLNFDSNFIYSVSEFQKNIKTKTILFKINILYKEISTISMNTNVFTLTYKIRDNVQTPDSSNQEQQNIINKDRWQNALDDFKEHFKTKNKIELFKKDLEHFKNSFAKFFSSSIIINSNNNLINQWNLEKSNWNVKIDFLNSSNDNNIDFKIKNTANLFFNNFTYNNINYKNVLWEIELEIVYNNYFLQPIVIRKNKNEVVGGYKLIQKDTSNGRTIAKLTKKIKDDNLELITIKNEEKNLNIKLTSTSIYDSFNINHFIKGFSKLFEKVSNNSKPLIWLESKQMSKRYKLKMAIKNDEIIDPLD